ncbi:MAG: hypothetical protein MJ252_13325, partial [archaeon]|nr:hypothetical protein [archaeon]
MDNFQFVNFSAVGSTNRSNPQNKLNIKKSKDYNTPRNYNNYPQMNYSSNAIQNSNPGFVSHRNKEESIPYKDILKIDLYEVIKSGQNFDKLSPYIDKMLNLDLTDYASRTMNSLINSFQDSLKYLYLLRHNIMEHTERIVNESQDESNPENRKKKHFESQMKHLDNKIQNNSQKIRQMEIKLNKLREVLIKTGNQNKIASNLGLFLLKDDENNFYCQYCANRKFRNYDEVTKHYIKHHYDPKTAKINSQNITNNYNLGASINLIKQEITKTMREVNEENKLNDEDQRQLNEIRELLYSVKRSNENKLKEDLKAPVINYETNIKKTNINDPNLATSEQVELRLQNLNNFLSDIQLQMDSESKNFNNDFQNFQQEVYKMLLKVSKGEKIDPPQFKPGNNTFNFYYQNNPEEDIVTMKNNKIRGGIQRQKEKEGNEGKYQPSLEQNGIVFTNSQGPIEIQYSEPKPPVFRSQPETKEDFKKQMISVYKAMLSRDEKLLFSKRYNNPISVLNRRYNILPIQKEELKDNNEIVQDLIKSKYEEYNLYCKGNTHRDLCINMAKIISNKTEKT